MVWNNSAIRWSQAPTRGVPASSAVWEQALVDARELGQHFRRHKTQPRVGISPLDGAESFVAHRLFGARRRLTVEVNFDSKASRTPLSMPPPTRVRPRDRTPFGAMRCLDSLFPELNALHALRTLRSFSLQPRECRPVEGTFRFRKNECGTEDESISRCPVAPTDSVPLELTP